MIFLFFVVSSTSFSIGIYFLKSKYHIRLEFDDESIWQLWYMVDLKYEPLEDDEVVIQMCCWQLVVSDDHWN